MKKMLHFFTLTVSFSLLFLLAGQPLQAQTFTDPVSYMNFIGAQHREMMQDMMSYSSSVAHGKSARKVEKRRQELMKTTTEARKKVAAMAPYEGDKTLRDSTVKFFQFSYHVLNEDYGKIMNLEDVAEQSYDGMEAYLLAQEIANQKMDQASERINAVEKAFAQSHKVNLVEGSKDELSEKLAKTGRVNDYHRVVYLIFFKNYKQEAYMMDALQNNNVSGIEQNKTSLQKYAEEGLAKLDTIRAFSGDRSLVSAAKQVLEFYRTETKDKMPIITGFYLKQENFAKIKKAFEAKREKDRTQADVDQFNKAVNEANASVGTFNATNKQLNESRQRLIEGWNKASQTFLDKHTPTYK